MKPEEKILYIYNIRYIGVNSGPLNWPIVVNTHEEAEQRYIKFKEEMAKCGCKAFELKLSGTKEV